MFKDQSKARDPRSKGELEEQFFEHYHANHRSLHRFLARMSGTSEDASDLTQEVFARFWREIEQGRTPDNVRAWLFRVGSNLVINRAKTRARVLKHSAQSREEVVADDVERTLIRKEIVERALRVLPEPMRQCLLLYHEGLTGREIAAVLGVKESYVGTLVLRAHERFKRECEAAGGSRELLG